MPRPALTLVAAASLGVLVLGSLPASAQDAAPPTTVAPPAIVVPTTVPATAPPGESTVPASSAPASTTPATTDNVPSRSGTGGVDVVKGDNETWSVRRIATTVGIAVVVLAIAGFIYGRVRSSRKPPSSALVTTSE